MTALPSLWLLVWLLVPSAAIARIHFAHGQRLFQQHDYRRALDEFTTAAESSPTEVPDLWFDIGQCHRNLGHARQATLAFEHYLALAPDAPDRAKVQTMLTQLGGHSPAPAGPADEPFGPALAPPDVAAAATTAPSPPAANDPALPSLTAPAAALTASAPPSASSSSSMHRRRWIIWGSVAGAVVVGALAVGLGVGLSGTHAAMPTLGSGGTFDTRSH
jgi:tetratricopeptide (TPR) repeat protein